MKTDNSNQKTNQEAKMKTIFYNMDIKNNICADCGKNKSMDYASINNGIIICSNCAKEHEKLGYNISYIRSLGDKWDDYLFNYIKAGGNSRFIQFCKDYKVDKGNNNIIQKYKSKGLTYYRDIIRSEVLGYDPPDNINVSKAYEEEPEIPDNYPEFKKYSFVKHVDKNFLDINFYKKKEEKVEDEGIFGMIGGIWGSVKKKVGDEAGDLMKKVSEIDYSGVKEKGASMLGFFFGSDDKIKSEEKKELKKSNEENKNKDDGNFLKNIFGIDVTNFIKEDKKENKKEENILETPKNEENEENMNKKNDIVIEENNQKKEINEVKETKENKIEKNEINVNCEDKSNEINKENKEEKNKNISLKNEEKKIIENNENQKNELEIENTKEEKIEKKNDLINGNMKILMLIKKIIKMKKIIKLKIKIQKKLIS